MQPWKCRSVGCGVLVAAMWTASGALAQVQSEPAGKIAAVIPATTVSRGLGKAGIKVEATRGTPIVWQDTVQTTKNGRARILLNDQSVLSLGTNSKLRVIKHDAASQQTSLELAYGRIRCQVSKITAHAGSFELRTPTSVAGVIGTDFGADASIPGQTKYICISGKTRIYTLDRQHYVDCEAGQTVTINASEQPSEATAASSFAVERWQHVTEPGDPRYAETLQRGPNLADWAPQHSNDDVGHHGIQWHGLDISGSWRLRMEGWNWFSDGTADNSYLFGHSIFRLGLGQRRDKFDWQVELAQPSVFGLPDNPFGPGAQGQLGFGGSYIAANGGHRNYAFLFPSKAFVRLHGFGGNEHNQLTVGRFSFVDGMEVVSRNPTLAWLKEKRITHRLIGDFGFAVTGRSADGAWLGLDFGTTNLTFAGGRPTRGVFQMDGLGELDVAWQYGAVTVPVLRGNQAGELRVFGAGYQDFRAVAKTDNRPAASRPLDDVLQNINIATVGFDYLHAIHTRDAGIFDFMVWAAGQAGSWGTQEHRAGALAAEVGWQPDVHWHPWLRAGYFVGSGDGNASDNRHETFFQMLPTPRIYARFPFYDLQNNTDVSGSLLLRPNTRLTFRSDVHALWLTSRKDLWYLGGGAFQPHTFGYVGRPGGGKRGLANLWDLSADYNVSRHWVLGFYYGHAWTKGAVRSVYPSATGADFGYMEVLFKF